MQKIFTSNRIYVSSSKIKGGGRGVFARCNVGSGELIERCPIIDVPKSDTSNLNRSILVTYFLYHGKGKKRLAVLLGYGSIYNHSPDPNATFKIKEKDLVVEFTAIKTIKKDDEITFDYRHGTKEKSPLWFEA